MRYRVSVLQYEPKFLKQEENLEVVKRMLNGLQTDLVVLPELALSGYVFVEMDEVMQIAESVPDGKCFQALLKVAKDNDFSIVYGFAERAGDLVYNSSALLNPDGSYHVYRKTHLFYREKLFFEPGDTGFAVYPAKGGVKIGMMICFDWQFPESARTLAMRGAQIICHPSNLVLPWCQQAMITRSLENRVFTITSNRIGTEINGDQQQTFTGAAQILGTKGEILARMETEGVGIETREIDPSLALDKSVSSLNGVFADRRPDFYER
ncbi:MAG: nitrilase-related carbon-nitrogen hydrolase [Candidatus Cloacimonadaceae bacterium]|jgi:predicted amidohydrolase